MNPSSRPTSTADSLTAAPVLPRLTRRLLPALLASLTLVPALVLAFDGLRLAQMLVLTLSASLWILWPLRARRARTMQALLAGVTGAAFLLDACVRGFILQAYGAVPDSMMVVTALANTSRLESVEFIQAYWPNMLMWAALLLFSLALLGVILYRWWRSPANAEAATHGKAHRAILLLLLLALLLALSIKPWRHHHPAVFWPLWAGQLADTRAGWQRAHLQHSELRQRAAAQAPVLAPHSPDTLVIVMSESVNRDHLSLYGYSRDTTPRLAARAQNDSTTFKVFRHAWASDASTVPALNNFFYFGQPSDPARNHLLTLAAAAGYQTWWISNHDDVAIDLQHARLAQHRLMLNRVPGRSAASLDRNVLPELEAALRDGHQRKLIVVHLLGAHPHYQLRYPPDQAYFNGAHDQVDEQLKQNGRSFWTRKLRNEYDSALRFHDSVVDQTLALTRQLGGNAGWIFLSDHGQEVGSLSDHAGHSASSADGYRIPLLVWGNAMRMLPDELCDLPIREDWLAYSFTRLLGIRWKGYRPEQDFLDPGYRWQPPPHPLRIDYLS